jgi:hypothetical protein
MLKDKLKLAFTTIEEDCCKKTVLLHHNIAHFSVTAATTEKILNLKYEEVL